MAHLDGQTLASRLSKGKLPLPQALDISVQIADALSAAHRRGIVHRDLKPGNVMLTKVATPGTSGVHATLLDFGLAKLKAPQDVAVALAEAGVDPSSRTAPGMVVGTLPYMAPEQLEGQEADARTDLWALGALLYEMVTGQRAFAGDSQASLITAIMNAEPVPLSMLQPLTPPALDRLVRRCLAKAPDERPDTAHDVASDLRWVQEAAGFGTATGVGRRRRAHQWAGLLLAAGAAGLVVGAGVMWRLRSSPAPAAFVQTELPVRPAEELNAGGDHDGSWLPTPGGSRTALTWTPDGRTLVFVGRRGGVQQLYLRSLDAAEARPLRDTEGAQVPAVSPDGQWVAFWANGRIRKVSLDAGPAMDLAPNATPPVGLVWDERGQLYFARWFDKQIWRIPAEGAPRAVTTLGEAEYSHSLPWPLPGGHTLLYTVRRLGWSWGDEEIVAQSLTTGERTSVLSNAADARYLPTGHLVFLRQGRLFAVAFDPTRSQVSGTEVPVLGEVAQALTAAGSNDLTGAGQFAVSGAGTLAWISSPIAPFRNATLATIDRQGRVTPLLAEPDSYAWGPRLSPDGRRAAVAIRSLTGTSLWLYDLRRGGRTLVTREGEAELPLWSPDGQRLVFTWRPAGGWGVAVWPADGIGPPTMVVKGNLVPLSFTPDGRQLALVHQGRDILIASLDGQKATVRPLMETERSEADSPEFSPDGKWLAYRSGASGRQEVYVQPYPGPGAAHLVSIEGGWSPAWHPNGRELFFVSLMDAAGTARMMAVDFGPGSPPRIGRPHVLFSYNTRELSFRGNLLRQYDVGPDGQRFYTLRREAPAPPRAVTHINLVENWFEELKAKVPAR